MTRELRIKTTLTGQTEYTCTGGVCVCVCVGTHMQTRMIREESVVTKRDVFLLPLFVQ